MTSVHSLNEEIALLQLKVASIQEECSHPKACLTSTNRSNTGNYDPSADSYWTEHLCGLCEKQWRTDQ